MLYALVAAAVIGAWTLLGLINGYVSELRTARRIGRAVAVAFGAAAFFTPNAFAAGTTAYVDHQAAELTQRFVASLRDVLDLPAPSQGEPPPSSLTADDRPTRTG